MNNSEEISNFIVGLGISVLSVYVGWNLGVSVVVESFGGYSEGIGLPTAAVVTLFSFLVLAGTGIIFKTVKDNV